MYKMTKLACLILALTPCALPALAEDGQPTRLLVDQARYWQNKSREDLAADAWRKLLRAEPNHPLGLIQLGMIEARSGNVKEAQSLYDRASRLLPPPSGLNELATSIKFGQISPVQLATAREQAQAGQNQEAVKSYQEILGETKPTGSFGLEYYQALGATREGWDEARLGLEELLRNHPSDVAYRIALAKHLTYRETTRREGIRQLEFLSEKNPAVVKAWRQGLVWLNARKSDRSLLQAYLARYPNDEAVKERMKLLEHSLLAYRPTPEELSRQAGFQLLNNGEISSAEAHFRALLARNAHDSDALGGMGLIRLRQESFVEAAQWLDQAQQYDKLHSARWERARNSAHYWSLMQQVGAAREAGDVAQVESKLNQALAFDKNEPTGQAMLADLFADKRDFSQAEAIYRRILRNSPRHPAAFRGLVAMLVQSGRDNEAQAMLSSLDDESARRIGGLSQAKAAVLLKQASLDEKNHAYETAAYRLEDALLLDPLSPWVRLALARQYQKLGDVAGANSLLDNLLESNPNLPEALHARALLYADQQEWLQGLLILERIPVAARTAELKREQRRFWVNGQVQRAQYLASQGKQAAAVEFMKQAEVAAGKDTALLGIVAAGWSNIDEPDSALRTMREITARTPMNNVAARIQYAGILLNARQYIELGALLRELDHSANQLTPAQRNEVNNIILAYTLRQADAFREAGRLADAYDVLRPALAQSDDPRLLMALARIYNTAGEQSQALKIVEDVIIREPDSLDHRLFASGVALGVGANDKAVGHAQVALALAPDHPRALAAAGRAEKARGNTNKAMEYFQYAQALENDKRAFSGAPGNLSLRLVEYAADANSIGVFDNRNELLPVPDVRRQDNRGADGRRAALSQITSFRNGVQLNPDLGVANKRDEPAQVILSRPTNKQRELDRLSFSRYSDSVDRVSEGSQNDSPLYLVRSKTLSGKSVPDYSDSSRFVASAAVGLPRLSSTQVFIQDRPELGVSHNEDRSIRDEIDAVNLQFSTTLDVGGGLRNRSGEAGLSRLAETELAVEARIPLDYEDNVSLRLTPVMLSAGTLNFADPRAVVRFGSSGLGPFLATPVSVAAQDATGIALNVAYRSGDFNADIGTTPLGFNVTDFVGGMGIKNHFDDVTVRGSLNRRAVTDSLLSYAGARDPLTGKAWGGVVKTEGRIDFGLDQPEGGLYANAGYAALTGMGVKSNNEFEFSAGGYLHTHQSLNQQVTVGLNLTALGYKHNLSYFTLGHGGYFSPQRYVSFGVPADVSGRKGRLSYQVGGDLSMRSFRTDQVVYYPENPAIQAAWQAQVAGLAGYPTSYNATSVSGLGYSFYGAVEYLIAPKFALGGRFAFDNGSNYSQQSIMSYLRYAFDKLPQPVAYPPRTLRSLAQGDPQ